MSAALRAAYSLLSPAGRRARLTIFAFHRTPPEADGLLTSEPCAARFAEILRWIGGLCRVLPLADAIDALGKGALPSRAAAITFDDGYRNNLTVAKPALMAAGLPATVFIAVDPVERGIMWNDLVIESLRAAGGPMDLGDLGLGVFDPTVEGRRECMERLLKTLKYRDTAERLELADEIHRRVTGRAPQRQMLTEDEVRQLQGDGIELGSHTVNHPILTCLTDAEAEQEITRSRNWLEEITGRRPRLFAYPNGRPGDDYDDRHVAMVRRAGFSAALSTRWGAAHRTSPLFELPRFTPWDRHARGFAARIVKTSLSSYRPSH